jgi:hypothetical protein
LVDFRSTIQSSHKDDGRIAKTITTHLREGM